MNSKPEKIKYLLYPRKSTESEDRQVLSISSQIDELKKIAEYENIELLDSMPESRSAKTLGRPVIAKMIERINSGEAQGILCWKLDRLARNFIDGGKIIQMLQTGVIKHIRTFERSYYPQDNVILMSLEFATANQFSRDLAVNVERGMRKKAEMGWYPVQPPMGYLNSKFKGRGNNDIYNDEKRFALTRKMWDMLLTGKYSASAIWRIADKKWHLTTRKGGKLSLSNIFYIFANPFYYGMFEWPRGSGNWYKGKHEAMITIEEFDRAQILLGRKGAPRAKTHSFAFTGTIKCGECGAGITAEEKNKVQMNGNVHSYIYYHCTHKIKKDCPQKYIEEKKLTDEIVGKVHELDLTDEFHIWAMKWLRDEQAGEVQTRNSILKNQQKEYNDTVERLDRYIEMRANNELTEDEFREKKSLMIKEKARLAELLDQTDKRVDAWMENMENAFTFIAQAEEKLRHGTVEQRKEILSALGSNRTLFQQKLALDMEETLLPFQKISKALHRIHDRLEPRKRKLKQGDYEKIYSHSPTVCARLESNQRPSR